MPSWTPEEDPRALGRGRRRAGGRLRRSARSRRAAGGGDKGTQSRGAHTEENAYRGARRCGAREVPRHRASNVCEREPRRTPETRNFWRFRSGHAGSSQPLQVPEILQHCFGLLGRTPWETLASLLRPDVRIARRGTADHPGFTWCTRDVFDSDAGDHNM